MSELQKYLDEQLPKVVFDETNEISIKTISLEEEFAELIVITRKRLNLSQIQLAQMIGLQQSSLSKIEHGRGNPSLQMVERIARGLGKKVYIRLE